MAEFIPVGVFCPELRRVCDSLVGLAINDLRSVCSLLVIVEPSPMTSMRAMCHRDMNTFIKSASEAADLSLVLTTV